MPLTALLTGGGGEHIRLRSAALRICTSDTDCTLLFSEAGNPREGPVQHSASLLYHWRGGANLQIALSIMPLIFSSNDVKRSNVSWFLQSTLGSSAGVLGQTDGASLSVIRALTGLRGGPGERLVLLGLEDT